MFWRMTYHTELFHYVEWFMAADYNEAVSKAETLACGARYELSIAPLGVLWGNR